MKLHVGGAEARAGWTLMNIQDGPGVDVVGDLADLSFLVDECVEEIYASHVLEHVPQSKVEDTLKGVRRVLVRGGLFKVSVPDLEALSRIILEPAASFETKFHAMRMMFGGQVDPHDFHYFGWTQGFMEYFLGAAGFSTMRRVDSFGLFNDTSEFKPYGRPISLNIIATR